VATPTDEFPVCPAFIEEDQHGITSDFDFSTLFMSYPDMISYNEGSNTDHRLPGLSPASITHYNKTCSSSVEDKHCGCLNENSSYSAVLELSLRLRKAAGILSRSANHRMGTRCQLQQRVAELDTYATYALILVGFNCKPDYDFTGLLWET
jgi:hypothetical protein